MEDVRDVSLREISEQVLIRIKPYHFKELTPTLAIRISRDVGEFVMSIFEDMIAQQCLDALETKVGDKDV